MEFKVHHENRPGETFAKWCGPAALSAVLDITAEDARARINSTRYNAKSHYQTGGVSGLEIAQVLSEFGATFDEIQFLENGYQAQQRRKKLPTLATFREALLPGERAIIGHTGHFVAYDRETDFVAESSKAARRGQAFCDFRHKLRRVEIAWVVEIPLKSGAEFKVHHSIQG